MDSGCAPDDLLDFNRNDPAEQPDHAAVLKIF